MISSIIIVVISSLFSIVELIEPEAWWDYFTFIVTAISTIGVWVSVVSIVNTYLGAAEVGTVAGLAAIPVSVRSVSFRFYQVRNSIARFRVSFMALCNIGINLSLANVFGVVTFTGLSFTDAFLFLWHFITIKIDIRNSDVEMAESV